MRLASKKTTALSAFTMMLLSQNVAFAQTVYLAEAPVTLAAAPITSKNLVPQAAQPRSVVKKEQAVQFVNLETPITAAAPITNLADKTADTTRWLLKAEPRQDDSAKPVKDYSKDFSGLRTSILGGNNTKIGTAKQYNDADETPFMKANRASQNLYSKRDDNFLLRAKLDF